MLWIFAYLLTTPLTLGFVFKTGLHFPGPDFYQQVDHRQWKVISWILLNGLFYAALPLFWLNRVGFRFETLFYPWPQRRNLWIIAAYWALDFFGPIIGGVDFFSLSKAEYVVGVPTSVVANDACRAHPTTDATFQ